ncbi:MAG: hypothetical protein JWN15_378 [Firmicutes bacterium]|nr:hypothetical protein [Bacillota bacterium]
MDWAKARAVLLIAFTVVNLMLAYFIWGPSAVLPGVSEASPQQVVDQVRATLAERSITLPTTVTVPRTPGPMRFLHVEYHPTPRFTQWPAELSDGNGAPVGTSGPRGAEGVQALKPTIDKETQAIVYQPAASGPAARDVKLDNPHQVQQVTDDYLRQEALLPAGAVFSDMLPQGDTGRLTVEYVPMFDGYPVFSGYVRADVSARGIETVRQLWVQPGAYTEAPPKAVRPAPEALLRLAGRLQNSGSKRLVIREIKLGYYANRSLTVTQADGVNGWDTVPVWRISLDTGEVYYINAFNGEWES